MKRISEVLVEMLVRDGMHDLAVGAAVVETDKGSALSTMASGGEMLADAAGRLPHRPTTRREMRADMNSGKGPGAWPGQFNNRDEGQQRFGQSRSPVLEVHMNPNMSGMPMTKRVANTPFLICIAGGRA